MREFLKKKPARCASMIFPLYLRSLRLTACVFCICAGIACVCFLCQCVCVCVRERVIGAYRVNRSYRLNAKCMCVCEE